jgi:hypothetical protein
LKYSYNDSLFYLAIRRKTVAIARRAGSRAQSMEPYDSVIELLRSEKQLFDAQESSVSRM